MPVGRYMNEQRTIYTERVAPNCWWVYIGKITYGSSVYAGSITREPAHGEIPESWTLVRHDSFMSRIYGTRQDAALAVAGQRSMV